MGSDLTDREVARALRLHRRTIQRWCAKGLLPGAYKAGRSWRIPRRALRQRELDVALVPDGIDRELRAATLVCHQLLEECIAREEGRTLDSHPRRDWRSITSELRKLESVLQALPKRETDVPTL